MNDKIKDLTAIFHIASDRETDIFWKIKLYGCFLHELIIKQFLQQASNSSQKLFGISPHNPERVVMSGLAEDFYKKLEEFKSLETIEQLYELSKSCCPTFESMSLKIYLIGVLNYVCNLIENTDSERSCLAQGTLMLILDLVTRTEIITA